MTTRPAAIARVLLAATATTGLVLATSACSGSEPPVPGATRSGLAAATAAPSPQLERYYTQDLAWSACGSAECAELTVPLDYQKPDAATDIRMKVTRVKARDQEHRLGSLLANPGGPGASGVSYVQQSADSIVGPEVRRYFDLVGFDPRGVAGSEPIDCLSDRDMDTYLGTDSTPDDPAEEQALLEQNRKLAAGCVKDKPELVKHMSTAEVARDMDVLRAAVGDRQLNYLGKSYGTFIGSTYADLFPQRVGRVVLDGVVPPDLTSKELAAGQAKGFQIATNAYLAACVQQGDCPLGDTVPAAAKGLDDFFARMERDPLPTGDAGVPRMDEAWARLGVAYALYDQNAWNFLTQALQEARSGSAQSLMQLANGYADRQPGGGYRGNLLEAINAVNCLDRPDSPDLSAYEGYAREFSRTAPTWGATLAWGALPCGIWPARSADQPHEVRAPGADPIVVIGTTRDPATIYEWSKRLADQLDSASLITFDGDGHTAYGRSNSCVDSAVDAYFVQGRVPKDGLTC